MKSSIVTYKILVNIPDYEENSYSNNHDGFVECGYYELPKRVYVKCNDRNGQY